MLGSLHRRRFVRASVMLLIAGAIGATNARAVPRFALLTGTRCSGCHVNIQGGGPRNELGWSTMSSTGGVGFEEIGLGFIASETNQIADGLFSLGFDLRLQMAKLGRPPNDKRKVIPMQAAPSATLTPNEWLTMYVQYNAGPLRYPGQTALEAAAIVQPDFLLPSLKVGHFQPTIGVRWDDHTLFVRRDQAGGGGPIVAPNYAEYGAELSYEGNALISATVGAFMANNLSRAHRWTDSTKPVMAARLMLWPQVLEQGINGNLGASVLVNDRFTMVNAFAGVGLSDRAGIEGEVVFVQDGTELRLRNVTVNAYWQFWPWLTLEGRVEEGETWKDGGEGERRTATSYVAGLEFFPLPCVELRPEYRYVNTYEYTLAQYALQLHLFY